MALQKQLVPLAYGGGLDTKTDPASVPLGKWLVLENCVFAKPKSLHKRNGYASLTASILGGGSIAAGAALAARSNELLLGDGTNLYGYDSAVTSWVAKGAVPAVNVSTLGALNTHDQLRDYDAAVHPATGLQCVVMTVLTPSAHVRYAIVDTTTGQVVVPPTLVDTGVPTQVIAPRVCVLGNYFLVFMVSGAGLNPTQIYMQAIAVTAPQTLVYGGSPQAVTSGTTTLSLNEASVPQYDICVQNGVAYVVFINNSGTTTIFGITAASPYAQPYSVAVAGTTPQALCICGNNLNNDVVVGITQADTTATAFAYNANLSSQTKAPTTIDTQAAGFASISAVSTSSAATAIQFFIGWGQTIDDVCYIRQNTLGAAYAVGTASTVIRSLKLAGKPFAYNGAAYLPTWQMGSGTGRDNTGTLSLQETWFVIDTSGRPIAKAFAGLGAALNAVSQLWTLGGHKYYTVPGSPLISGSVFSLPVSYASLILTGDPSGPHYQASLVRLDMSAASSQTKAQLGDSMLFSGAVPMMYDGGANAVEQGFLYYPEIKSVTQVVGGGALNAGTYQYIAVYSWRDATGQVHRSTPSPAKSVTVGNLDRATVVISTLRLTVKTQVDVDVYRTVANGTTFYKITTLSNNTAADTVTLTNDGLPDGTAAGDPQLYTTGGVLQAAAPPSLTSIVVHRNRIFGIDPTTGQVAYTKQYIYGGTGQPIEFSGFLTMNITPAGGAPTALASLDDKLIVFKSDRIFMVLGQGPDSTGGQNDFGDAILVNSDTGCSIPRSAILTPDGIMFKSPKGFYLLDRALRLTYVGAGVESYNSANVTSAQLVSTVNQVRFTLDSGVTLVYDYYLRDPETGVGQWSVFTNINAVDAALWQGKYVYLTAAGIANQETAGTFADPGSTFIPIKAVSPWIQLAQVQGFQRVYRVLLLAIYLSAHKLRVKLAYDFQGFTQTDDVTVSSDPAPYQTRIHCAKQKCEAIQISVEDISTGTIGEGLSLSGLMLEAGIKRGAYKLPAARSFG